MEAPPTESAVREQSLEDRVAGNRVWYHTMGLAPGLETPGWFDLRPILRRMPWPDVRGKRCLEIGTYDGFLAFEMERRGASEIVATDVESHEDWDWPVSVRDRGSAILREVAGPEKGRGFEIARDALGSSVKRELISVYDLNPERLGTFDVVVCGSLLIHLRDPLRALDAVRSVCRGSFMSTEELNLRLTALHPKRPMVDFRGGDLMHWWVPNAAAHRALVTSAGFSLERTTRPYCVPFGEGHPARGRGLPQALQLAARRVLAGGTGVPHAGLLARPAHPA